MFPGAWGDPRGRSGLHKAGHILGHVRPYTLGTTSFTTPSCPLFWQGRASASARVVFFDILHVEHHQGGQDTFGCWGLGTCDCKRQAEEPPGRCTGVP